jgi:predicted DNA binding protein
MGDSKTDADGGESAETDSSPLRVVLTVTDRETLLDMMETLDDGNIPFRTENITQQPADDPRTVVLDSGDLTGKQRSAVEIAVQSGYYEQPRKADLTDLAEQIGISKSAVSQRLRSAEAKLVKNIYETDRDTAPADEY